MCIDEKYEILEYCAAKDLIAIWNLDCGKINSIFESEFDLPLVLLIIL